MDQMFSDIANMADQILEGKPKKEEPHDEIDLYVAKKINKLQEELEKGGIYKMFKIEVPKPLIVENQEVM